MKIVQASQTRPYPKTGFTGGFQKFWNAGLNARFDISLIALPLSRCKVACCFPTGPSDQLWHLLENHS